MLTVGLLLPHLLTVVELVAVGVVMKMAVVARVAVVQVVATLPLWCHDVATQVARKKDMGRSV